MMHHRETVRLFFKASLIVAGIAAVDPPNASAADRPPNIIYVMLDDAGVGDFGAFGSKHVMTPVFDRMCDEGTRFTQHYSGSAVCAPTRCVLMTGLHTGHCRRRGNAARAHFDDFSGRPLVFLEDEDVTIAESLKQAGYVTGGIGKWGLGNPGSSGQPDRQGFDHWFGYLDQVHAHNHYPKEIWDDGKMVPHDSQVYMHDRLEQETLAFVERYQDRPFFLYLAYTLPHGKYVIPHDDPAYQPYRDKPWPDAVRNYAAMITRADRSVGLLLAQLKALDLDRDTVVFYTSDNGPNSPFLEPLNSNGPHRGIKRSLYEGGIRAAMAVRWPGKVPAGRTSPFVWDMRDVFPTACELAGVDGPDHLDGISVLPTLLGKPQVPRSHLFWEFFGPFQQAVRLGSWKGIRFGTAEPLELYQLDGDPHEDHDLATDHPEMVKRMEDIMAAEHVDSRYWPTRQTRKRGKAKPKK